MSTDGPLKITGHDVVTAQVAGLPGHTWLLEIGEQGNDTAVEVLDSKGQVSARADHPERRTGTQRIVLAPDAFPVTVRIKGQEEPGIAGTAVVRAYDLEALRGRPECLAAYTTLARADSEYAAGKEISSGRVASPAKSARELYQQAAEGYESVDHALTDPGDRPLRGETQLAVAGVEYSGLQDWAATAEWATLASKTLEERDVYRRERAQALLGAAVLEIGTSTLGGRHVPGFDEPAERLLGRARGILSAVSRFHLARGEQYDAGLQLNNIAVTYLYAGHFAQCAAVSQRASRVFASVHEAMRQGLAKQNRALCLWGLGQLPEALEILTQTLPSLSASSVPILYIGATNNTALANYALGHFDDALRLFDSALRLARQGQWPRDEAQSLFGIGITYYALGDRGQASQFLELSRAKREETKDGRGRMQTLRALATVYVDQGRIADALTADKDALSLAVAPPLIARIRIQTARHLAAAGRFDEALSQLNELIAAGVGGDVLIRSEALLQRAEVLRTLGRPRDALKDLAAARPALHERGSVMEEFESHLETARALRETGQPEAALAAVERALALSDAVRMQSANPELRAQLQTPLRPAYDLKLDLLWARFDQALAAGRESEARDLAMTSFVTADASRARSLADVAAQKYSPAIRSALAHEFRRREALSNELAGRRFRLDDRLDAHGSSDPGAQHLMQDIAELQRQLDTVNLHINSRAMPDGAQPRVAVSLPALPADTTLVSYWLGSDFAYAWVLSPAGVHWVRLASPPPAIAEQAAALQDSMTRLVDVAVERRLQDARTLYGLVIQPIEPWVAHAKRWIMVPDGALDFVPFAALIGPGGGAPDFVALRHDVAVAPAVWLLSANATRTGSEERKQLLVVADPVYEASDPRLGTRHKAAPALPELPLGAARRTYARIPDTAAEARAISAQFPAGEVKELTGLEATRERLLSLDWSAFRFIHIATHGVVDAQVPELSALILGSYDSKGNEVDGAVRVADLALEKLNADVVVFSGCDTALGKQLPSEGLLGLSSTALARGARAVVASLWPVTDEMGARLMTDFYRHLLHEEMSAPAALGAAMRSVVTHDRAADPALWGAFQVSVDSLDPARPGGNARPAPLETTTMLQERP